MSLDIDEKGTIFIHQGDSGNVIVDGLNTDKNYSVYFAVKNNQRQLVGSELCVNSNFKSKVTFNLPPAFTDAFVVPDDEPFAIYTYGLKVCSDNSEDTLFVENTDYGYLNKIIVFPKQVEGYNG